jgi:hypothetical protein
MIRELTAGGVLQRVAGTAKIENHPPYSAPVPAATLGRLTTNLDSGYELSFVPPRGLARGAPHRIRIEWARPGAAKRMGLAYRPTFELPRREGAWRRGSGHRRNGTRVGTRRR